MGELVQEPLIALSIHMREWQEERFSRSRFDCSIQPKRLEQPLPLTNGFDATGSDQPSYQGFEPQAALILSKIANGLLLLPHLLVILLEQLEVAYQVSLNTSRCSWCCLLF